MPLLCRFVIIAIKIRLSFRHKSCTEQISGSERKMRDLDTKGRKFEFRNICLLTV